MEENKNNNINEESNEIRTKVCNKCGRELPATIEYFHKKINGKYGLNNTCKECRNVDRKELNKRKLSKDYKKCNICGRILYKDDFNNSDNICKKCEGKNKKINNKPVPTKGYKFCIKCGRELPSTNIYFPPDKLCKDGLRNVCRECGEDKHFMKDGYIPKKWWTDKENELFKKVYPYFTNEELIDLYFPNETLKSLADKAFKLGKINKTKEIRDKIYTLIGERYSGENNWNYGKPKSDETKRKLSEARKGKYLGKDSWNYGIKWSTERRKKFSILKKEINQWKGNKNPRHIHPLNGELNGRWEGGIKALYCDLRDHLQIWKKDSMEYCNYKCYLTGLEFDNIHHLYPFKNIVKELFQQLNYETKQTIGEYTDEQINNIYNKLYELHKKYGVGICLSQKIHKLFHDTYGYMNFNKNNFNEFTQRYYNGEFDDELEENLKSYNSIKRLQEANIDINERVS